MSMRVRLSFIFVIAVATIATGQPRNAVQNLDYVTDPEAHRIYAAVVPPMWATRSKDPVVLRRETEDVQAMTHCRSFTPSPDPEWGSVEKNFWQENARRKVLPAALPFNEPYRLITLAEIEAIDAKLAIKYPGIYNERPESPPYAAVSAVGFSADKTKAMVYVRLRGRGEVRGLELRDGQWLADKSSGCVWIA
jgi:hypothetical protein